MLILSFGIWNGHDHELYDNSDKSLVGLKFSFLGVYVVHACMYAYMLEVVVVVVVRPIHCERGRGPSAENEI